MAAVTAHQALLKVLVAVDKKAHILEVQALVGAVTAVQEIQVQVILLVTHFIWDFIQVVAVVLLTHLAKFTVLKVQVVV